jgi:hypothetical protein
MRCFVSLALVLFAASAVTPADAAGCWVVELPRGQVVLYAKPSASSVILARLHDPQLLTLDETDDATEWMHVTVEGKENLKGWVKGKRVHRNTCG